MAGIVQHVDGQYHANCTRERYGSNAGAYRRRRIASELWGRPCCRREVEGGDIDDGEEDLYHVSGGLGEAARLSFFLRPVTGPHDRAGEERETKQSVT